MAKDQIQFNWIMFLCVDALYESYSFCFGFISDFEFLATEH